MSGYQKYIEEKVLKLYIILKYKRIDLYKENYSLVCKDATTS